MSGASWPERRIRVQGIAKMTDSVERAIDPQPADPAGLLQQAVDKLSLGLVVFDAKCEVVFCNKRYMEIYRLSSEQVKPGTTISELIRHRLGLELRIRSTLTTTSVSGSTTSSIAPRPSRNSPTAGSSPLQFARCRAAAACPPMRTSPGGKKSARA